MNGWEALVYGTLCRKNNSLNVKQSLCSIVSPKILKNILRLCVIHACVFPPVSTSKSSRYAYLLIHLLHVFSIGEWRR